MQFTLEVAISKCYFIKHSQGILGVKESQILTMSSYKVCMNPSKLM